MSQMLAKLFQAWRVNAANILTDGFVVSTARTRLQQSWTETTLTMQAGYSDWNWMYSLTAMIPDICIIDDIIHMEIVYIVLYTHYLCIIDDRNACEQPASSGWSAASPQRGLMTAKRGRFKVFQQRSGVTWKEPFVVVDGLSRLSRGSQINM